MHPHTYIMHTSINHTYIYRIISIYKAFFFKYIMNENNLLSKYNEIPKEDYQWYRLLQNQLFFGIGRIYS